MSYRSGAGGEMEDEENFEVIGSVIYEEPGSGEIVLNFYTSTFNSIQNKRLEFPQEPLRQTWRIDYPLLAYKCTSPDNREIALVHLG